jgi:hypothetical protein
MHEIITKVLIGAIVQTQIEIIGGLESKMKINNEWMR